MNRKLFILCLLISLCFVPFAFADTARYGATAAGFEGVVGLGDVSSGIVAEVTSVGSLVTTQRALAVENTGFDQSADTLIYTGACRVLGIYVTGESAGDWAAVYDDTTATIENLVFDPRIAANTSSVYFDAKGAPFSTGIYVNVLDNQTFATIVYDY